MISVRAYAGAVHLTISEADKVTGRAQGRTSGTRHQGRWTLLSSKISEETSLSVLTRRTSLQSRSESPAEMEEEVTTSVTLTSGRSQARRAMRLDMRQTHSHDGVFSAIPHLLVYNVLPADSPVFSIVQGGRLREFQALLREGKASLRDQDEYGAPLLFVSLSFYRHCEIANRIAQYANKQPEMCRYLIQSGADVNYVANHQGILGWEEMYAKDSIIPCVFQSQILIYCHLKSSAAPQSKSTSMTAKLGKNSNRSSPVASISLKLGVTRLFQGYATPNQTAALLIHFFAMLFP